MSSRTTRRTVSWAVVSWPAEIIRCRRLPGSTRVDAYVTPTATRGEEEQHHHRLERPPGAEQDGHRDDRAELAERAVVEEGGAERSVELPAVAQDGQQHAERGRDERDGHGELGRHQSGEAEQRDESSASRKPHTHVASARRPPRPVSSLSSIS